MARNGRGGRERKPKSIMMTWNADVEAYLMTWNADV